MRHRVKYAVQPSCTTFDKYLCLSQSVFPLSVYMFKLRFATHISPDVLYASMDLQCCPLSSPHRDTPHPSPLIGSSAARDLTSSESIGIIWETLRHFFNRAVNDIKTCLQSLLLLILPDLYVNRKLSRHLLNLCGRKSLQARRG